MTKRYSYLLQRQVGISESVQVACTQRSVVLQCVDVSEVCEAERSFDRSNIKVQISAELFVVQIHITGMDFHLGKN